jgi:hypothetical protein
MQDDIIGYRGVGPEREKYIEAEDALAYAMERCGIRFSGERADTKEDFKKDFVEWFYSGNWIPVEQNDEREAADS